MGLRVKRCDGEIFPDFEIIDGNKHYYLDIPYREGESVKSFYWSFKRSYYSICSICIAQKIPPAPGLGFEPRSPYGHQLSRLAQYLSATPAFSRN